MSFLAPAWIALAAAASLLVAAIHLIAWRLPRAVVFPTARFVPDEPARRAARTVRLADIGLLALRVAILMAGGIAMARPVFESRPAGQATVIAIDKTAAVGDTAVLFGILRSIPRPDRTTFVLFDTTATVESDETTAMRSLSPRRVPASLSVGLLEATREAHRLGSDYERVNIVLVSPLTREAFDQATLRVRALWPDSIDVIRVAVPSTAPIPAVVEMQSAGDDPVLSGIRLARSNGLVTGTARVVRDAVAAGDSAWVDSGRVLVIWPRTAAGAVERVDGVHAGGVTTIGHFIPTPLDDSGRVAARWVNGVAAAREVARGTGCIRTIGFDVPDVGDFVLTPSFQRVAAELVGPCGGVRSRGEPASDSLVAALAAPSKAIVATVPDEARTPNRLAAAMMVLAILLLLLETIVRRRSSHRSLSEAPAA
jgi:hypothetical protein